MQDTKEDEDMTQTEGIERMTTGQKARYNDLLQQATKLDTAFSPDEIAYTRAPQPNEAGYAEYWKRRHDATLLRLEASAMMEAMGVEMTRPYRP